MLMPTYRRASASSDAHDAVSPPKRNPKAGRRLAPLPPGLRSGSRNRQPAASSATTADLTKAKRDFAMTAPASSSLTARPPPPPPPARNSSRPRVAKDGRRHLAPVSQVVQRTRTSSSANQLLSRLHNGSTPSSASSTPRGASSGLRAGGSSAATTASQSRRASNASGTSPSKAARAMAAAASSTPRATTSEGQRRPSLTSLLQPPPKPSMSSSTSAVLTSLPPQRVREETSPASASSTAASRMPAARVGRPKARPPVLPRTHAATADKTATSSSSSSTAAIAAALRTPVGQLGNATVARPLCFSKPTDAATAAASPAASSSAAARGATTAAAAAAAARVSVEGAATAPASDAARDDATNGGSTNISSSSAVFPFAPHDMDEGFYANAENWKTETDVPAFVWSLLTSTKLEPPYTTRLWTQAYPHPADLFSSTSTYATGAAAGSGKGGGSADNHAALPSEALHEQKDKRRQGFYACARCATPICSPAFQAIPAEAALRGIAVFTRMNMSGVELRLRTAAGAAASERAGRQQRPSFTTAASSQQRRQSSDFFTQSAADALLNAAGDLQFLVHCRHCGACLGAMLMSEVAVPVESTLASHKQGEPRSLGGATARPSPAPTTQALLCANSVCLQYMPYRTRAPLDGRPLDSDDGAGGHAGAPGTGKTLGFLFGPQSGAGWDLQVGHSEAHAGYAHPSSSSAESSFDELLDALNPYGGGSDASDSDG